MPRAQHRCTAHPPDNGADGAGHEAVPAGMEQTQPEGRPVDLKWPAGPGEKGPASRRRPGLAKGLAGLRTRPCRVALAAVVLLAAAIAVPL
jgi:hypothetical protein